MENNCDIEQFELLCVVVNYGQGTKVIKIYKEIGITGFTAFLGRGTIKSHLLDFLGMNDTKKEIIWFMAEAVIDAAVLAGSKGGTIINARGAGIHEYSKLLSMAIEPEKEIVMILSEANLTESITCSIRENLKLDDPGNGMLLVLDLITG